VGLLHAGKLRAEGEPHTLVAEAELEAVELGSTRRAELEDAIAALPGVLASSVHGSALRVVFARGESGALDRLDASLVTQRSAVPVGFEDVFLAVLARANAAAHVAGAP